MIDTEHDDSAIFEGDSHSDVHIDADFELISALDAFGAKRWMP